MVPVRIVCGAGTKYKTKKLTTTSVWTTPLLICLTVQTDKYGHFQPSFLIGFKIIYHLNSVFYHLNSTFYHLNNAFYHLNSAFYHLNSVFYHLNSAFYHLNRVFYHLNSAFYHLNGALYHTIVYLTI